MQTAEPAGVRSLYDSLAESPPDPRGSRDPKPPPDTIYTATIETIDNDRAYSLLGIAPRV